METRGRDGDPRPARAAGHRALLGSFTAAARELGYTQPAISQQVAALELELGQPLVQRRPVRATPAGERLAEHAARILLRLDVARSELSSLGEAPGEVRVGVSAAGRPRPARGRAAEPAGRIPAASGQGPPGHPRLRGHGRGRRHRGRRARPRHHRAERAAAPRRRGPAVVHGDGGDPAGGRARRLDDPLRGRPGIDLDAPTMSPPVVAPVLAGRGAAVPAPHAVDDGDDLPTLLALVSAGLLRRPLRPRPGRCPTA